MALTVTPGPIPKDGVAFTNVETQLTAFVNQTVLTNIGLDSFVQSTTPFVVSSSEAPFFRTRGQLWFRRGEGRLYVWYDKGVSSESWGVFTDVGNPETLSLAALPMQSGHWVCVSDRREIYAQYLSTELDWITGPYQPVRLEAGHMQALEGAYTDDTITWALGENRDVPYDTGAGSGLWGSEKGFIGMRLGAYGPNIYSSKLFVHTTNYTLPGRTQFAGVFHELGFRRVASVDGATGPAYAGTEGVFAGAGVSNPATTRALMETKKSIHTPTTGSPYAWDFDNRQAFVGYITQSGPSEETTRPRHLVFWFATCPRNNFSPT